MWACHVWCIALTLNTDKTVLTVSQPDSEIVSVQRVGCRSRAAAAAAAAWPWENGSHLVNTGAVSVKLQSTGLGLRRGVCLGSMHSYEREWSCTGCTARWLMRLRLADDSRKNCWSIGALHELWNYSVLKQNRHWQLLPTDITNLLKLVWNTWSSRTEFGHMVDI